VAEQCKFPHVTYFFNGFNETLGEQAVCLPSIPEAAIGDQPEMSAREITDAVLKLLAEPGRRAIIVNLANADQVGHTGRMDAAREAVGIVDREIARLHDGCQLHGWNLLITSDHGNADAMIDAQGRPLGSHSTSPVPLVVVPASEASPALAGEHGSLANVGATFLTAVGVAPPDWMEPSLISPLEETHV
jgi:2,3-bisphosphoglycerate-independent phosphoglycerate mutase